MRVSQWWTTAVIVTMVGAFSFGSAYAEKREFSNISGLSPFDTCYADEPDLLTLGHVFRDSEVEPWVAVNPRDEDHIVASWQQDRWSTGGARGLVTGVSFDGGRTWLEVPIPGLTLCTEGEFLRASDPWLTFTPDGDLYHISLAVDRSLIELLLGIGNTDTGRSAMLVQKSEDGGLSWSPPISLVDEVFNGLHDKQTITADPHDSRFVYAVWDRLDFVKGGGPALFSRTTNGGLSWDKEPRILYDPGPDAQTLANQIVVMPDGTLLNFFNFIEFFSDGSERFSLAIKRSFNHGETWLPPGLPIIAASMEPSENLADPDTGQGIRGGEELFDVAVDPQYGTIYAVWQDGRFDNFAIEAIALSVSYDQGATWTDPVKINNTPSHIPQRNRQAFVPSVEVNDKGRVAISYYDFRLNDERPDALTDYWAITCRSRNGQGCDDPRNWDREQRLTKRSFDILGAPVAGGLFLGDYAGLAAADDEFMAVFSTSSPFDPANLFSHRFKKGKKISPNHKPRLEKWSSTRKHRRSEKHYYSHSFPLNGKSQNRERPEY